MSKSNFLCFIVLQTLIFTSLLVYSNCMERYLRRLNRCCCCCFSIYVVPIYSFATLNPTMRLVHRQFQLRRINFFSTFFANPNDYYCVSLNRFYTPSNKQQPENHREKIHLCSILFDSYGMLKYSNWILNSVASSIKRKIIASTRTEKKKDLLKLH